MTPHLLHRRRALAAACGALALLLHAGAASAHGDKERAVARPLGDHYERSVRAYTVPDVVLTDADSKPVRLRELLASDEPVMLNFIFTTCSTVCPVTVKVFSDLPSRLGEAARRVRLVSISIDPENDTPAKLKSYSQNFAEGLRWSFLTGRVEDIKAVQVAFDIFRGDKMSHEPLTLMRNGQARPWVRIDGFATPEDLAHEYRKVALR